ncbi:hypothetical protein CROQUDRAFT_446231 [Cronartium quercuum f. sp. fusiforme G11]|uniref:Uncharacterized protein n=1 Tax=Cronartium quercuum f. sp. fusiforme G11 TaxID=708437 RepID=A0A9P6TDN4_9BASI|nr:hypothetical protein CROQUDRAFT_446231 [Cronartium quercuum f. sp. fusiforme G11]
MHDELSVQYERMGRLDSSIEEIKEKMSGMSTEESLEFLTDSLGTSQRGGTVSRYKFFQWSGYHAYSEMVYEWFEPPKLSSINTLKTYLDGFSTRTGGGGWDDPSKIDGNAYKTLEEIDRLRKHFIQMARETVLALVRHRHPKKLLATWTSTRIWALILLVIESMSGPHSKEALGALQFLVEQEPSKLSKEALKVATQFQDKTKLPNFSIMKIFLLLEHLPDPKGKSSAVRGYTSELNRLNFFYSTRSNFK